METTRNTVLSLSSLFPLWFYEMANENETGLRILIVDDEKSIRRFLKVALTQHGYNIIEASNAREALDLAFSAHPDVIILDLGLPDMDGLDVTRKLRENISTPIIILSVRDYEDDKVAALDAGADDYLTKPFSTQELLARLRAVMRRIIPQEEGGVFQLGNLSVDFSCRVVTLRGEQVHLTPTEYDIFKLLATHAGKVLTHIQILKEIWGKDESPEGIHHLLRVTVSNLRSKIEDNPGRPRIILTEPGVGYRLNSDE